MGVVDSRRPLLPAPTESIVDTTGGSTTGTDLATDISRRTDKTSFSIPDDGSPVTIPVRRKHRGKHDSKLSHSSHHSQTSLLIEYFEGGKGSGSVVSRPSVRVRVTPSSARKNKDQRDRIQISEASGDRKPSYSRRISLSSPSKQHKQLVESGVDDQSASESNSAVDENHHHHSSRHPPVEIEFVNRDQTSEMSTLSRDARYMQPTSDISSMPADSMLDASSAGPRRKRSQSLDRAEKNHGSEDPDLLKTPARQRSRSLSKERIAHRVAEKLSNPQKEESSSRHRRSEKGRRDSKDVEGDTRYSRRRHHAYRDEEYTSPESSLLSNSAVSSHRRSGDQYSIRSGTSKSSINNPKLLETVEDAIRRLILPELKELKKDQKVISNTSKFERDLNSSYSSASPPSRDGLGRRLSKHASAPDVMKPKVVLNKNSKDEGIVLAGDPTPPKKERKSSRDSQSSESYVRWGHRPDLTEQDKLRRQRSKGLRHAEKAAIVGTTLTAAALKRHDSKTSLDEEEGERRGSVPRSRTGSVNETELVFQKHNVPGLPLRSEIDSELTRDSILSQRTEKPAAPRRPSKVQEVPRESPVQIASPVSARTPNYTPLDTRYELGKHHSNFSSHDLSIHSASDQDLRERGHSPLDDASDDAIAAAAAANLLDPLSGRHDSDFNGRGRTLSPIQSVASDQSDAHIKHLSPNDENWHSEGERGMEPRLSIGSLSSAPSTNLARSTRPDTNSVQSQSQSLRQPRSGPELGYEDTRSGGGNWEEISDVNRHSLAESSVDGKRVTDYADDSELNYMDKIKEGQHVAGGVGANPQFVHPLAVESAVASLLDPSVLESTTLSGNRSAPNLPEQFNRSPKSIEGQQYGSRQGSPLKQQQNASDPDETSFPRRMGATSPPQSVSQSIEDQDESGHMPDETRGISPLPDAGQSPDSESEINTNPSIIQGPIGGVPHGNRDHWVYGAGAPKAADVGSGGQEGFAQDYYQPPDEDSYEDSYDAKGYFDQQGDGYDGQMYTTPPGAKDEGYMSGANPLSPSITPQPEAKGVGGIDANGLGLFDSPSGDDPFATSHQRNLSGYSHGVGSPLYDSAMGRGIERIKSKDIVALMDHLTVRDAQRNARDTEILVTLVRSAAEMRTSFEEMKKFIAQQDGLLMEASDKQHERTYRALGPRPIPGGLRSRQSPADDGDERSKRQNVFKRALKGLSLKSSNDLGKVEEMLEQLLEEVEALRATQDPSFSRRVPASVDQNGYEMNGQPVYHGDSGYGPGYESQNGPRLSEDRANTMRGMNDWDVNERDEFLSPQFGSHERPNVRHERAGSAPVETPTRMPVASGALSNETSPRSNEKGRKHKSSSSSFFPKISRWSKTTASSMGDNLRNSMQSGKKDRPYMSASRSGSDLNIGQYGASNFYDPQGDDRIRSNFTLGEQQQENRPPSPLVPSQVSEPPKYRAHRGSLDLQHPQPRQGPSGRYQTQLESQVQDYSSPISPATDPWGSNPSLSATNANHKRVSGASRLSPISDAGYSDTSSRFERQSAPPRPPKIADNGPLVPERPPKINESEHSYGGRVTSQSSIMRSPRNTPPVRKPTGPRPLTSGQYSPDKSKRTRYRGSPNQIDDEYYEY